MDKPSTYARTRVRPSHAYADFMARAYTMELEAAERYAHFAERLDAQDDREIASLFRGLGQIEALHAKRILDEMGWASVPALPVPYAWEGPEAPETAPSGALRPPTRLRHVLEIALECELRAQRYFESIAAGKPPARVRAAAAEMAAEERRHAKLIRTLLESLLEEGRRKAAPAAP